jgi:hypothetical protein
MDNGGPDVAFDRPKRLRTALVRMAGAALVVGTVAFAACEEDETPTPAPASPTVTATSTGAPTGTATVSPTTTVSPTATTTASPTATETATPSPTATVVTGPSTIEASSEPLQSDGTTLVIPSATLPVAGFVAIHSDQDGAPGPVIGVSELLPEGESTDIEITLDEPLTASGTVYPMVHVDANGNGVYEFPGVDVPGTTDSGDVAVVAQEVEVAAEPTSTPTGDAASMTAEDQVSDGATVVIASVTLPNGGFVAIHSDDNGAPGPVIGVSGLLDPGTTEDVEVTLDTSLEGDATVFPMAHLDANANGVYEFPGPDGPALDAEGNVVVLPIAVTVQGASDGAASIEAEDQIGDGSAVLVASVTLPDGGFVAVHADEDGAPGPVIGVSELLGPGTSEDVEVPLDTPLETDATVYPMAHVDGDANGEYEFPGPDVPAVDDAGEVVVVAVEVTVQAEEGAGIEAADQSGDGTTVVVASVTLPEGGFVAVHSDANGAPGPVIGVSDLLDPGTSTDVEITFDTPLEADAVVYPMAHVDANANGEYNFPGPDVPAVDSEGNVVMVPLNYTVEA